MTLWGHLGIPYTSPTLEPIDPSTCVWEKLSLPSWNWWPELRALTVLTDEGCEPFCGHTYLRLSASDIPRVVP